MSTATKAWCADPRCGHSKSIHTARGCPLCPCDGHIEERAWNPYFDAYARAQGTSPAAMLQRDAERFPGGKMAGFIGWIALKKAEFTVRYPEHVRRDGALLDRRAWSLFLDGVLS